jgi:hypothetical protein
LGPRICQEWARDTSDVSIPVAAAKRGFRTTASLHE